MIFITAALFVCLWSVKAELVPTAPDRVFAVQGSCVLISCSFPSVNGSGVGVAIRLRYRPSLVWPQRHTAFSSDQADRTERKFRGRVTLNGDPRVGNCSLTITNVSTSDPNTYELELREGRGSWGGAKRIQVFVARVPDQPELSAPCGGVRPDSGPELFGEDQLPLGAPAPTLGVGEGGCRRGRTEKRDREGAG
ncbi:sialic acid-binding Ig-like lectin 12 isoform X2 [Silurus meridionalis]|uniref:sialic acid-binding Ig-like lectin 12 isoform X2 n=1 Tax=Silurus meridionalis TaxID=175797 RepID=UPI001EEB0592|nr:sialic acid-binding Ig-like lectin 12 isoform X2 [Silurus meridionalis]